MTNPNPQAGGVPLLTAEDARAALNTYGWSQKRYLALLAIAEGRAVVVPAEPTQAMIEAGAQRLVQWEDGSVWPDSWDAADVRAARKESEKVLRSGIRAAARPLADTKQQEV